jgi:hypothetical protein
MRVLMILGKELYHPCPITQELRIVMFSSKRFLNNMDLQIGKGSKHSLLQIVDDRKNVDDRKIEYLETKFSTLDFSVLKA